MITKLVSITLKKLLIRKLFYNIICTMKKLIFLLLLLPLIGFAQNAKPITGFNAIKFGASPAEVKAAATNLGGEFNPASRFDTYFFSNLYFNNHKVQVALFKFFNNKLYSVTLGLPTSDADNIMAEYRALINEINAGYGEGTLTKEFNAPYKDGDGHEVEAIVANKATYNGAWSSKNAQGDNNQVAITINNLLSLYIFFSDGTITKQHQAYDDSLKAKPKAKKH